MTKTKKHIYWIIYAVLYCSVIQMYIWSNQFCQLIPDVIILFLCIFEKGLTNSRAKKNNVVSLLGRWIPRMFILFLAVGLFSDAINLVKPTAVIWGVRMVFRYSLLFLLIIKNFDESDLYRLRKVLDYSFYINAVFVFLQFFMGMTGDLMGGIWGSNGELSTYIICMTFLYSGDYFNKRMKFYRYALSLVVLFTAAIWGEIKMLYFIMPLCVYGSYVLFKKFSLTHVIVLAIAWVVAIPVLTSVLSLYYDEDYVAQTLNREELEAYNTNNYGFTEESLNRGTIFEKSVIFLNSPIEYAVGHGLGSGNMSSVFHTDLLEIYASTCYGFFTMSYLLIEVGYVGLVLFILVHVLLLYRFWMFYLMKDKVVKYWAAMGMLVTGATFLIIYYNSIPLTSYYLGYLFWAMCFLGIRERIKRLNQEKNRG